MLQLEAAVHLEGRGGPGRTAVPGALKQARKDLLHPLSGAPLSCPLRNANISHVVAIDGFPTRSPPGSASGLLGVAGLPRADQYF